MSRMAAERRQEIFSCTLSLVASHGYDAVTMDQISAATRASKATLYRHWTGKADLVAAAAAGLQPTGSDVPDTGSLRGDVHELVRLGLDRFTDVGQLAGALSHAANRHPELRTALLDVVVSDGVFGFGTLLDRAVERGELPADHPGLRYAPLLMVAIVQLGPVLSPGTGASAGARAGANLDAHVLDAHVLDADSLTHYLDHVVLPVLGFDAPAPSPIRT